MSPGRMTPKVSWALWSHRGPSLFFSEEAFEDKTVAALPVPQIGPEQSWMQNRKVERLVAGANPSIKAHVLQPTVSIRVFSTLRGGS